MPLSADLVEFAANILKTVGHPIRLRIVELLEKLGEAPVNRIQEELQLPQPIVSLRAQRKGGLMVYSVSLPQLYNSSIASVVAPPRVYNLGPARSPGRRTQRRGQAL